jgi:hypothetical protein
MDFRSDIAISNVGFRGQRKFAPSVALAWFRGLAPANGRERNQSLANDKPARERVNWRSNVFRAFPRGAFPYANVAAVLVSMIKN